jgi:hypothetical protein
MLEAKALQKHLVSASTCIQLCVPDILSIYICKVVDICGRHSLKQSISSAVSPSERSNNSPATRASKINSN